MSFKKLQENGVKGVKANVQFVGHTFDLASIMSNEQLRNMTQEEFEAKISEQIEKFGRPKAILSLES